MYPGYPIAKKGMKYVLLCKNTNGEKQILAISKDSKKLGEYWASREQQNEEYTEFELQEIIEL